MIKKLSRNIFLLYKLRQFVQQKHLLLFFNAHIMSHLNYASTIWDGCSQDTFKKLNSIHRRAVKQINCSQATSTDEKLKKLNILPLKKQLDHDHDHDNNYDHDYHDYNHHHNHYHHHHHYH